MIITFATEIKGKPTYFVKKILRGLLFSNTLFKETHEVISANAIDRKELFVDNFSRKIHTIRRDFDDKWAVGDLMHMVSGLGTKERVTFSPKGLEVKWIQTLRISKIRDTSKPNAFKIYFYIDGKPFGVVKVQDGSYRVPVQIDEFIKNDGFDSAEDFFNWFDGNYNGKIICWVGLPYGVGESNSKCNQTAIKKEKAHA